MWQVICRADKSAHCPYPPPADGTETASLFASLGTEVLPEEEEEGHNQAAAGVHQSASDRDDYSSGEEQPAQGAGSANGAGSARSSGTPNGRLRWQGSRGSAASDGDLPADAGARAEAAAQQAGGEGEGGSSGGRGDSKILRELFEESGVRGAIDHSKVEGAHDPNLRAADHEAARIARRAAEALRQSRLQCQQAPVNQPTWTGRSGGAGLPANDGAPRFGRATNPRLQPGAAAAQGPPAGRSAGGRFGGGSAGAGLPAGAAPRSSEILARLRERQAAVVSTAAAAAAADPALDEAQQLADRVASFLEARGGSAASDELVQHFQGSVGPAQMPLFRGVLKQVAQLQRRGAGKAWVLRPEYASGGRSVG